MVQHQMSEWTLSSYRSIFHASSWAIWLTSDTFRASHVRSLEQRIAELETAHGNAFNGSSIRTNAYNTSSNTTNHDHGSPNGWTSIRSPLIDQSTVLQASHGVDISTPAAINISRSNRQMSEISSATPKSSSYPAIPEDRSPSFLGASSAAGFMAEVYQTVRSAEDKTPRGNNHSSTRTTTPPHPVAPPQSHLDEMKLVSMASEFVVPPRSITDRILESYWLGAHPLQPFILRRVFMARYEKLWSSDTSGGAREFSSTNTSEGAERLFYCMLNSILALGCRFWSVSNPDRSMDSTTLESQLLDRSKKLLDLDLLDEPSVRLVQAILLLVQCLQNRSMSNKTWVLVGMAIRVAQAIGLHLDVEGESQERREERRRTMALCVLLDRMQSMTFGRPLMLTPTMTCTVPQIIDEEFLNKVPDAFESTQPQGIPARTAFFVYTVTLSDITAEILRLSYQPVLDDQQFPDYSSLSKVDRLLERWHEDIPDFLRYGLLQRPSQVTDLFTRQTHLLHHRYLHSKLLLFRRVVLRLAAKRMESNSTSMLRSVDQSMASSYVDLCTTAAQELIDVIHPHIGTQLVPPGWHTTLVLYTAGTALAVVFITPSFRGRLGSERFALLRKSWEKCIDGLRNYEQGGHRSATSYLENLKKLYPLDDVTILENTNTQPNTDPGVDAGREQQGSGLLAQPDSHRLTSSADMNSVDMYGGWSISTPHNWWLENDFESFIELAQLNQ